MNEEIGGRMEEKSKSNIIGEITWAFIHQKNLNKEWIWKDKKGKQVVSICLTFKPPEVFVDKNGIKWVRAE